MDAFVWDQNFVTGVEDIDDQHHALVDLFNELSQTFYSTERRREEVSDGHLCAAGGVHRVPFFATKRP
jgi:hemerythrin